MAAPARTTSLAEPSGELLGPLEDKGDAAKLIELLEDAFDLCRYYNILQQAMAASERIFTVLDTEPAIVSPPAGRTALPARGRIEFDTNTRELPWE